MSLPNIQEWHCHRQSYMICDPIERGEGLGVLTSQSPIINYRESTERWNPGSNHVEFHSLMVQPGFVERCKAPAMRQKIQQDQSAIHQACSLTLYNRLTTSLISQKLIAPNWVWWAWWSVLLNQATQGRCTESYNQTKVKGENSLGQCPEEASTLRIGIVALGPWPGSSTHDPPYIISDAPKCIMRQK